MAQLSDTLPLLLAPFAVCLLVASLHCYMGLHVVKRGVIFVDLALAQSAALGAAVALFLTPHVCEHPLHHPADGQAAPVATETQLAEQLASEDEQQSAGSLVPLDDGSSRNQRTEEQHHEHDALTYGLSLTFALLGAVLLSLGRLRDERIPHEAIIGIIFVVSAALSVLILSKAPHGHERMQAMLVGSILFVSWPQVPPILLLYLVLGAVHIAFRKRFIRISQDVAGAERAGIRVRYWDCLFYGTFALMVTQSVSVAGVLVVFSYLIIPAACAVLFADRFKTQLFVAWAVAVATTVAGLLVSAVGDLPTGPSLVACFGAALVVSVVLWAWLKRSSQLAGVVK
jgi:zinc/manganese transport system permease protein